MSNRQNSPAPRASALAQPFPAGRTFGMPARPGWPATGLWLPQPTTSWQPPRQLHAPERRRSRAGPMDLAKRAASQYPVCPPFLQRLMLEDRIVIRGCPGWAVRRMYAWARRCTCTMTTSSRPVSNNRPLRTAGRRLLHDEGSHQGPRRTVNENCRLPKSEFEDPSPRESRDPLRPADRLPGS